MDFLKYLDILIGLAVVMVLLSPLVSAATQLCMWVADNRSKVLKDGIQNLVRQLEGEPLAQYDRASAAPNAQVRIGDIQLGPNAQPIHDALVRSGGRIRSLPDRDLRLVLIPAASLDDQTITSSRTDDQGKASVSYNFKGPMQYASTPGTVTVRDGNGAAVAANVDFTIASGPDAGKSGRVTSGTAFAYPTTARIPPAAYDLELKVMDLANHPLAGHTVEFRFLRNTAFDRVVELHTEANGEATVPAGGLGGDVATIAQQVLLHPMICKPEYKWLPRSALGEVIEREEFIRILLELAANEGGGAGKLGEGLRQMLANVLAANGIPQPATALSDIRTAAQEEEKKNPSAATHVRQTAAIIKAIRSDFVGKVNNWFDQTMDRTTQRYAFQARSITVGAALFVAFAIQMDSFDLLKRLSTDDKLRDALVKEASDQQKRIDDAAKEAKSAAPNDTQKDELQLARAKREEIEANLGKLRAPNINVLPDHFIWERLPQAKLVESKAWKHPFPRKYELVLGSLSVMIEPRWRRNVLEDLKAAIDGSGAPVRTAIERQEDLDEIILTAPKPVKVKLEADGVDIPLRSQEFAQTKMICGWEDRWTYKADAPLQLVVGYSEFEFKAAKKDLDELEKQIKASKAPLTIGRIAAAEKCPAILSLTATDTDIGWIELRAVKEDPSSNLLDEATSFESSLYRVSRKQIEGQGPSAGVMRQPEILTLRVGDESCHILNAYDFDQFGKQINKLRLGLTAEVRQPKALVLRSQKKGPLQLRYTVGEGKTNILDSPVSLERDWSLLVKSWPGVLLTWILLSMGAPFWYDALKNLLKLRPALAAKEESDRKDRQTEDKKPERPRA